MLPTAGAAARPHRPLPDGPARYQVLAQRQADLPRLALLTAPQRRLACPLLTRQIDLVHIHTAGLKQSSGGRRITAGDDTDVDSASWGRAYSRRGNNRDNAYRSHHQVLCRLDQCSSLGLNRRPRHRVGGRELGLQQLAHIVQRAPALPIPRREWVAVACLRPLEEPPQHLQLTSRRRPGRRGPASLVGGGDDRGLLLVRPRPQPGPGGLVTKVPGHPPGRQTAIVICPPSADTQSVS